MNLKTSVNDKNVLIIGGGVAGMAAARKLNNNGITVHLVEKNDHLGGHASSWACMSTDSCQHCSACLSFEMADELSNNTNLNIHLDATVSKIEKINNKYITCLKPDSHQSIEADKIILATGFQPMRPEGLIGKAYKNNKQIVTTVELNQILKCDHLYKYLSGTRAPKIGFIQCVGSRNRTLGRDYCSQVCCKNSLRHIDKLLHLYPDAKITLFYIDLQIMGKEIRSKFTSISKNIDLIQGVPFEFFSDTNEKISVIREDENTGKRMEESFDMMVLSVGIQALENQSELYDMLEIPVNDWNFTDSGKLDTHHGIYAAGCVSGPADILTAIQQGERCAGDIIQKFSLENNAIPTSAAIAVIGDGDHACKTALAVSHKGYDVSMFGLDKKKKGSAPGIQYIPDTEIVSIDGAVKAFTVLYKENKKNRQKKVAAVIVAQPPGSIPVGGKLNLSCEVLHSLKVFSSRVKNAPETIPGAVTFWLDYAGPGKKSDSRTALKLAIALAKNKCQVTFIITHMLVHRLEGQQLYDTARKQGISFLRITSPDDVTVHEQNKKIKVTLKEKTLKNVNISFESDWLVIPDKTDTVAKFPQLAGRLKDHLDSEGYLQSANVRHRLTGSPRKGIFYTGSCHDETDHQDKEMEIEQILFALSEITDGNKAESTN